MRQTFGLCLLESLISGLSLGCGSSGDGGDDRGEGGAGGATDPSTSTTYVAPIRQGGVDKIDLLFVIDNSTSMADKQALLREAVPVLLQRLITPICVDGAREPTGTTVNETGGCSVGEPEFPQVRDLHIGVITSSLGAHGGDVCVEADKDDKAHLLGVARPNHMPPLASWAGMGFLAWDPDIERPRNEPPGERNQQALIAGFQDMIDATGETGCGYEAPLEAWYRFLIDPEPPSSVARVTDGSEIGVTVATIDPPDQVVLAQRAAFLRPDSLLGIILLTDENDCSIRDDGQGWLVGLQTFRGEPYHLPRATSACQTNPDSVCCMSCGADPGGVPAECGELDADPECAKGTYAASDDDPNLRCFDQKRRFGIDLLYDVNTRYVAGLTSPVIESRRVDGNGSAVMVLNPLYAGSPPRDPALVFVAGIVGVPWQDIATTESVRGPGLEYLTYSEMVADDRWSLILGAPGDATRPPTPPRDPRMIETVAPGNDLEYACTFPLNTPRSCDEGDLSCECKESDQQFNRSICSGTVQTHAKAYPGVRHLQLLKGVGERTGNAVVASVCPKSTEPDDPGYGYTPAVAAIVERFTEALRPTCFPRQLEVDERTGRVPCIVVEAQVPKEDGCRPCDDLPGRLDPPESFLPALYRQLDESSSCGSVGQPECESYCLCEIEQLTGADLDRCQSAAQLPMDIHGFCYVDPSAQAPGSPGEIAQSTIVASCPVTRKRLLRFTGGSPPSAGAIPLLACSGTGIAQP